MKHQKFKIANFNCNSMSTSVTYPPLIQVVYGAQFEMSLAYRKKFRLLGGGKSPHVTTPQALSEELAQVTKAVQEVALTPAGAELT